MEKRVLCLILSLVWVACLGLLPAAASERAEVKVMKMFQSFSALETRFRGADWAGAKESVSNIEADYRALRDDLKGRVDPVMLDRFGGLMAAFKKKMATRDKEALEKPYLALQDLFLDIMEKLQYPNPPALIVIKLYIEEALVFLADGRLHEVKEEMEEIEYFRERALKEAKLARHINMQKLEALFEDAEAVARLSDKGDKAAVKARLDQMGAALRQIMR